MGLPPNAINRKTFPLTCSLRTKLERLSKEVYGRHGFVILSGLDPARYLDVENVVIHAGLSSHVGSKRGMPGREGGDKTVLSELCARSPQKIEPNLP